jgi:TolB protein
MEINWSQGYWMAIRNMRFSSYLVLLILFGSIASCSTHNANVKFLTRVDDYPAYHVIWSPTGEQLAFSSYSGARNSSTIYVLDPETKKIQPIYKGNGHLEAVAWTPDGTQLVFYAGSSNDLKDGLWIIDTSDNPTPRYFLDANSLAWSSSDQLAIGQVKNQGLLSISIRDNESKKETTILNRLTMAIGWLSWSSDGSQLTFVLDHGQFRRRDIYLFDTKKQEIHQVTTAGTNDSPSLSPNGNMIAYVKGDFSGSTPSYSLHIMNSDGTCDTEVTGLSNTNSPAWSPDGQWIAFIGKGNRVFLYNVFGSFEDNFLMNGLSCN